MQRTLEDFNWSKYENWNGKSFSVNASVKGQTEKTKVYSHENYAQELFDIYNSKSPKTIGKDLNKGDSVLIGNIIPTNTSRVNIELFGGLSLDLDMEREKRFIQLFGFSSTLDFLASLRDPEFKKTFLDQNIYALVTESYPTIKISLWQGHIKKTKDEFMREISKPSKAYIAKILEANRGGFFVDVQGVEAFMPGSLAAPNKIMDFQSYIGKEVIVMIEDFLNEMNSFIVSHKKYIEYIMPQEISKLSFDEKYKGGITGTSKYGIFVEFNDIFTGLLHRTKMKEETLNDFNNRKFSPGDKISFYISEITKDSRIILTEESPEEKRQKINSFIEKYKNTPFLGEIAAIMNFGIIVNIEDLSGVVLNREFKKMNIPTRNLVVGERLKLNFSEVKDDKLIFVPLLEG